MKALRKSIDRAFWPVEFKESWAVKGVHVNGCVSRPNAPMRSRGHAHLKGSHKGWMCIKEDAWRKKTSAFNLAAMLISGSSSKTQAFRDALRKMNVPVPEWALEHERELNERKTARKEARKTFVPTPFIEHAEPTLGRFKRLAIRMKMSPKPDDDSK